MPVTTERSSTTDLTRGIVVAVLAVVQLVVAGLGGSGAARESVGEVARSYPTPVLPANWTFAIWGPIYVAFLAYAGYRCSRPSAAVPCTAPPAGGWRRRPC